MPFNKAKPLCFPYSNLVQHLIGPETQRIACSKMIAHIGIHSVGVIRRQIKLGLQILQAGHNET
eukprot:3860028-Karenia_brevis.AAC.1